MNATWTASTRALTARISHPSTRQGAAVLADQLFTSLVTFAAGVLVAHANDKGGFADFFLALTIVYLAAVVQRSIVAIPLQVLSRPLTSESKATFFGSALALHLALNLGLICILSGAAMSLVDIDSSVTAGIGVAAVGFNFREMVRATLLADLKAGIALRINAVCNAIILVVLGALFAAGHLTTFWALALLGIASFVPPLVYVIAKHRDFVIVRKQLLRDWLASWSYGRWILGGVLANALSLRAIPWVLLYFSGKDAVAVFGALATVAGLLNPFIQGLANYVTPKLANVAHTRGPDIAVRKGLAVFRAALLVAFAYSASMAAIGDALIELVYPNGYTGYALVLAVLALEVGLKGANLALAGTLRAVNRPRREFFGASVGACLAMVLALGLIPHVGVSGAAYALLGSFVAVILMNRASVQNAQRALQS